MTTPRDTQDYIHRAAVDAEGNRIGKISQVYFADHTGQPLWVLVETGLFGTRQSFAPIHGSGSDGELVVLAVSMDQIKDAPNIDRDAHISESEQDALRQYSGTSSWPPGKQRPETGHYGNRTRPRTGEHVG